MAYVVLGVFTPMLATPVGVSFVGPAHRLPRRKTTASERLPYNDGQPDARQGVGQHGLCHSSVSPRCSALPVRCFGGIWADQSWGRFWGWDPKENGALLIVIWNAIILHARWGGLVRERGLMNLALFGNIVTAFLLVRREHARDRPAQLRVMDAAFKWLMLFNVSQGCLILLALLPLRLWKSFRNAVCRRGCNLANGIPRRKVGQPTHTFCYIYNKNCV